MLTHLKLRPRSGLGNRLHAIASARRLCQRLGARCSLMWFRWGDFWSFFAPQPDLEVIRFRSWIAERWAILRMSELSSRVVDVSRSTAQFCAGHSFWGSDEEPLHHSQLRPFFPTLSDPLAAAVERFHADHLTGAVGMHIRRTDQLASWKHSPDELFIEQARKLVAAGKRIFLATDNVVTQRLMRREFGAAIITYPKRTPLAERWPRPFDQTATEDDLIDLFLLGRTEYVLGSKGSSYTSVAMALNGSPQCRVLSLDRIPQAA